MPGIEKPGGGGKPGGRRCGGGGPLGKPPMGGMPCAPLGGNMGGGTGSLPPNISLIFSRSMPGGRGGAPGSSDGRPCGSCGGLASGIAGSRLGLGRLLMSKDWAPPVLVPSGKLGTAEGAAIPGNPGRPGKLWLGICWSTSASASSSASMSSSSLPWPVLDFHVPWASAAACPMCHLSLT